MVYDFSGGWRVAGGRGARVRVCACGAVRCIPPGSHGKTEARRRARADDEEGPGVRARAPHLSNEKTWKWNVETSMS